ncbi:DnaJ domain-containing protein [Cynara cardunculus var. scolymus]|uniref:DnaJ domain-containing protein n=1 Tax=Cynara cardunculus var. scolymus TaxID=59895 RepID=A0A103YKV5_CYNCS|nr:DnaJ domain-containing protein [Cynara cardunculus var. scolymus]
MDEGKSMDGSCYYSVLGISKGASSTEIRSAYRKLALEWHPDKWTKKPSLAGEASRKFQKIQEAYSVLSDQAKKSMYDAGGLDLLDDVDDNEVESLEDLQKTFVEMFGDDLREFMEKQDQTGRKRARVEKPNIPRSSRACR